MIRSPLLTSTIVAALAAGLGCAPLASGQTESAGLGRRTTPDFDLENATTATLHLGVTYLGGTAFVSARGGAGGSVTAPHSVFAIDVQNGNLLAAAEQPTIANLSPWGFRDGATDGSNLYFGTEFGIFVCDPTSVQNGTPIALASTPFPNPIGGAGLSTVGIYRAVAFNPNGDGGAGSVWTGNFGSPIIEIDLQGNVLQTLPNPAAPDDWDVYGLAFDPLSGNLWCNSAPFAGRIAEIDLDSGSPNFGRLTGRSIRQSAFDIAGGESQGGLDIVPGGLDGRGCGFDLLALRQGGPDTLTGFRLHLWDNYSYEQESTLQIGMGGTALGIDDLVVPSTVSSIQWQLADASASSVAYTTFINVEPGSLSNRPVGALAPPLFRSLWEFRRDLGSSVLINGMTNPAAPFSVGTAGLPLGDLAIQAIKLDPAALDASCGVSLPLAVSAQRRWRIQPPSCEVTLEANGANTFNSEVTQGFWRLTNLSGQNIISFSMSFAGSAAQPDRFFDTDQTGIGETLEGGNSTLPACAGTYRNGSDATVGLDYSNTAIAPCDPAARTGFVGSDVLGNATDFSTLTFEFTDFQDGEQFEFDADTDGGTGNQDGSSMASMLVSVTLADGRVCTGVLIADPVDPNISIATTL